MRSQHTIFRTMLILALSLLPAITSVPYASYAATLWYVAPNGNDSNSCSSPSAPCATINGAMAKAASGDTINVAGGTYYLDGTLHVLESQPGARDNVYGAGGVGLRQAPAAR